MDARTAFLGTLVDLAERIEPGSTEYDLTQAAGLLRRLLLDGTPLMDQLKGRDRTVRFLVNRPGPIFDMQRSTPGFAAWAHEDGFDPETAMSRRDQVSVDRDGLLKQVVIVSEGRDITVRELIRFLANVEGGVHVGAPKSESDRILARLAKRIAIGGYPAGTRTMQAVGRVILRGLGPLRAAIQKEVTAEHR